MQMGCSASKVDNEEVVLMCRDRKRFIKQAVDQRYVLAAAHVDYIQALFNIGTSLRSFAEREMPLLTSLPAPASPTVSSHDKKSPEHVPEKSSTTSSLHLHSDSHSHSHHSHSHSHSPSESSPAESPTSSPFHEHSQSPPLYGSPTHFHYMRSVNTPARTVEERPGSPERVTWNSYSSDNQYGIDTFFGIPMGQNRSYSPADTPPGPSYSSNNPPPPPPPPNNNAWDFFNPFATFEAEGAYYPYYGRSRLSPASEGSSRDSKHVREEEGIPDLEEEDQGEDGKKKVQWEKKVHEKGKAYDIRSPDNVVDYSTRSVPHPNPDESIEDKKLTKGTEGEIGEKTEGEAADVPVDKAVLENTVDNEDNDFALLVTQGKKNMIEVLVEIENEFKRARDSGKELEKMLETNKVPYRPRFSVFKVLSARILNAINWHQANKPSGPSSSKRPYSSKPKELVDDSGDAFDEDYGMNSGSHLSTLDKIYAWEKKLYEEVKAGEKIRIEYEKKITQLRLHDDKGEDPHLVDATRTAIKSLQTRIEVAMKAVDSISKTIHMLRDEELQPQVVELIQGFMRMWKVMLDCHQRQNKIVAVAKSLGRVTAGDVSDEHHLKATIHLESELQNWHACFSNWVGAQKAYVQALNGWLLKCIHQEPEQTSDGLAPFSPRRVGAPPVFVICNDWSQSFRDMQESQVVDAIEKLAAAIKQVYIHQDEEQRQKRKAAFLEKDLVGRAHLVEKMESRLHEPQPSSDKKHESDIGQASAGLAEQKISIESFRKHVEEENARHNLAMQKARNLTLNTLQTDLKHVFEALVEFSSSALKTYEQLVNSEKEFLSQVNGEHEREDFSHANGETSYIKDA